MNDIENALQMAKNISYNLFMVYNKTRRRKANRKIAGDRQAWLDSVKTVRTIERAMGK